MNVKKNKIDVILDLRMNGLKMLRAKKFWRQFKMGQTDIFLNGKKYNI